MAPHFPWCKSSNPSNSLTQLEPLYPPLARSVPVLVDSSLSLAYTRNIPSGSFQSHSFSQLFPDVCSSPSSLCSTAVFQRRRILTTIYKNMPSSSPTHHTPLQSVLHPSYSVSLFFSIALVFLFFVCFFFTFFSQVALIVNANTGYIRHEGLIPGSGRSLGGGHGKPLQYSCLENPMDRGA